MNKTNEIRKDFCPRCHSSKMKSWNELGEEEKMLAEKSYASAEFTIEQRKKHYFCVRCWYEQFSHGEIV